MALNKLNEQLKKISLFGIMIGFITVVLFSLTLSLFNLVIFSGLLKGNYSLDVLTQSTGPLLFSLVVIYISVVVGIIVSVKIAKHDTMLNGIIVVLLYALFSYWLSRSPSNLENPYPLWFELSSYAILLPAFFTAYVLIEKLARRKNDSINN